MTPAELEQVIARLAGKTVARKGIIGNTIEMWLDLASDDEQAIAIAIDPPWRLVGSDQVLTTSADIPWDREDDESEADYRQRLEEAWALTNALCGVRLIGGRLASVSHDLRLEFTGGLTVESFGVCRDEENWNIRLYGEKTRYSVSMSQIEVRTITPWRKKPRLRLVP